MGGPVTGLARLERAAGSGVLDALCARYEVRLLTVFGSAARREPAPRDLDVGVLFEHGTRPDLLAFVADLADLAQTDVDVARLDHAGPVLRERALLGTIGLYESERGALATAATAALGERIDTDASRRRDLELLAEMTPRRLDWQSVRPKLRQIERFADVLESFGSVTAADLDTDIRTALAIERALTLLVELAFAVNAHVAAARLGRSPDTYAESFTLAAETGAIDAELAARLRPSAGMRNVLVHAYLEVDHEIVAASLPAAIADYTAYARQVASWFAAAS